jgi:hypothetical protein
MGRQRSNAVVGGPPPLLRQKALIGGHRPQPINPPPPQPTPPAPPKFVQSATAYGGTVLEEFEQGNPDSYGYINLDPKTREGACYALAALWLIHSKNGTDFSGTMRKPSGVKAMNNKQVAMAKFKESGGSSVTFLTNWLVPEGFVYDSKAEYDYPADAGTITALGTPDGFKHINLQFNRGGHAIAATVLSGAVRFYEPNYGVVRFTSADGLKRWFAEKLLPQYDAMFGMSWFRVVTLTRSI